MAEITLEVEKYGKPNNRDSIKLSPGTNVRMTESANGDITITLASSLSITAITISGATTLGTVVKASLPTADPVVATQLWSDSGTVKVSAG